MQQSSPAINAQASSKIADQLTPTAIEFYKLITEVTNDCLWDWDIGARTIFWIDGGHKRAFGFNIENEHVEEAFWESRIHPSDRERVLHKLHTAFEQPSIPYWEDEYRFKKADGVYAYVADRGKISFEAGRAVRITGATLDITARKMAEAALYETERKLSLIARETVNAVVITGTDGKIVWVNEAFTRISHYTFTEVMGRKPGGFLQGEKTNSETVRYLHHQIKEALPFDCELVNYARTGRPYWIHIQGQALFDNNGNCEGFFAIQTDITEKKLLEHKLNRQRRTRQKAITEAVLIAQEHERSDIGKELHDNVNQILGAAKLFIEMAKKEAVKRDAYLDKACEYLLNSINEIRRISKKLLPQTLDMVGLGESIRILIDDLADIHPVKIEFREECNSGKAIEKKLQINIFRIIQEQVNNILKHSAATYASIDLITAMDSITLNITDNGKGCNTKDKRGGVGVRNIESRVRISNGHVTILSKPGEGYSMHIVFSGPSIWQ